MIDQIPQLSFTIGVPKTTPGMSQPAVIEMFTSLGARIVGSSLSTTVTHWPTVAMFPELSVIIQVTNVFPTGNNAGASLTTVATPQLSEFNGADKLTATSQLPAVFAVTLAGAITIGLILSITVTS